MKKGFFGKTVRCRKLSVGGYYLQNMSIILRQVSILEKLALCYFFCHKIGSVLNDEYITCLFTCKQAPRTEAYKMNVPRKVYINLFKAYNFINRVKSIYAGILSTGKFSFSCNRPFSGGKCKNLVPPSS